MFRFLHIIMFAALFLLDLDASAQYPSSGAPQSIILCDGINGSTAPPGLGNGWGNNAYLFLQDAITRANDLSVPKPAAIWVRGSATGGGIRYRPDQGVGYTPNNRHHEFRLAREVYLYGGFYGNETIDDTGFQRRNPAVNTSVLSGEIDNPSIVTDNTNHILVAIAIPGDCIVDGFTISGGYSMNEGSQQGVPNPVYFEGGSGLAMVGSGFGHPLGVAPFITRCIFTFNAGIRGGAVFLAGGQFNTPTFYNCQFFLNAAGDVNTPPQFTGWGGAFFQVDFAVTGEEPEVGAKPSFHNCLFRSNFAENAGGAMYFDFYGRVRLYNCTMADNVTRVAGGGIFHKHQDQCNGTACLKCGGINLQNSIIWGNNCTDCTGVSHDQLSGRVVLNSTCVQDLNQLLLVCSSQNATGADPQFINAAAFDYRLSATSPLRDLSDMQALPDQDELDLNKNCNLNERLVDLDGKRRVIDGYLHGVIADLGAYERGCLADLNGINGVDQDDLLIVITNWGPCGPPSGPLNCVGSVVPACGADQDDLLAVTTSWGCSSATPPHALEDVMDCIEICAESEDFVNCVNRCVLGLGGG